MQCPLHPYPSHTVIEKNQRYMAAHPQRIGHQPHSFHIRPSAAPMQHVGPIHQQCAHRYTAPHDKMSQLGGTISEGHVFSPQ